MYDDFLNFMNYPYTVSTNNTYNNYRSTSRAIPATKVPTDILEIIKDSANNEGNNTAFYNFLIANAPTVEDREIIEGIRKDNTRHSDIFRRLYLELNGLSLPKPQNPNEPELNLTYIQGLEVGLKESIESASKYRRILSILEDRQRYNMVMEALVDVLRHASLYNYLITKNLVNANLNN